MTTRVRLIQKRSTYNKLKINNLTPVFQARRFEIVYLMQSVNKEIAYAQGQIRVRSTGGVSRQQQVQTLRGEVQWRFSHPPFLMLEPASRTDVRTAQRA